MTTTNDNKLSMAITYDCAMKVASGGSARKSRGMDCSVQ